MAQPQIDTGKIRQSLLARCEAYCAVTGTGMSILSIALTGSSNYLGFLKGGRRNITLDMIERIHTGLDSLERTMECITYGRAREIRPSSRRQSRERSRQQGEAVY